MTTIRHATSKSHAKSWNQRGTLHRDNNETRVHTSRTCTYTSRTHTHISHTHDENTCTWPAEMCAWNILAYVHVTSCTQHMYISNILFVTFRQPWAGSSRAWRRRTHRRACPWNQHRPGGSSWGAWKRSPGCRAHRACRRWPVCVNCILYALHISADELHYIEAAPPHVLSISPSATDIKTHTHKHSTALRFLLCLENRAKKHFFVADGLPILITSYQLHVADGLHYMSHSAENNVRNSAC